MIFLFISSFNVVILQVLLCSLECMYFFFIPHDSHSIMHEYSYLMIDDMIRYFHFNVFLTFVFCMGLGAGAWFALMKNMPHLQANSTPILAGLESMLSSLFSIILNTFDSLIMLLIKNK